MDIRFGAATVSVLRRSPRCARCRTTRHLITGDGPAVCRVCVLAWGWVARLVTSGPFIREPGDPELRHAEHRVPSLGCRACLMRPSFHQAGDR